MSVCFYVSVSVAVAVSVYVSLLPVVFPFAPDRDEYPECQVFGGSAAGEESSAAPPVPAAELEKRPGEREVVVPEVAKDGEHQYTGEGIRATGSSSVRVDVPSVPDLFFADERIPGLLPALYFPLPSPTEDLLSSPEFTPRLEWDGDDAERRLPPHLRFRGFDALGNCSLFADSRTTAQLRRLTAFPTPVSRSIPREFRIRIRVLDSGLYLLDVLVLLLRASRRINPLRSPSTPP